MSVSDDFQQFCKNLRMSDSVVSNVQSRYHSITKRINQDFWNSDSETRHSLYVGSYGRGTAIYTSDIDIVVELPWDIFSKYDNYSYNGQSALLQAVKNSLMKTYSSSYINADGQVVDIAFSDGVKFEVVPAFKFSNNCGYYYPDTHDGGSWKSMNPKSEIDIFNGRNLITNGNLKRLCRMIRAWNAHNNVFMPGVLIDTLAYKFMQDYEHSDKSYMYYDWMSRDFFQYLTDVSGQDYWLKPGSNQRVYDKYGFEKEAKEAHIKCIKALDYCSKGYNYLWNDEWREIYGNKFPTT
ncbi:MAG: nucleotidyltransferase domain-containing protein [Clostridia bacterium]|nr:nucleotidyltransferase domain-containing protein [Clostridia bacterium]